MAGCLLQVLPIELEEHIVGLLNLNEIACTIRLVNKAAAAHYPVAAQHPREQHPTVRLSQPVPHHAFAHRCGAHSGAWIKSLTLDQRIDLLFLTATSGDLVNLELAVGAAGFVLIGNMIEVAGTAGHVHVCQWLRQRGCPWGAGLSFAAKAGRREVCEWLLANGYPSDPFSLRHAARYAAWGGHLGLAEWFRQQLPAGETVTADPRFVTAVAYGCDLPALQRYYSAWRDARQQQQQQQQAQAQQQQQDEEEFNEQKKAILALACSSPTPDWGEKVAWLEAQGCPGPDDAASHLNMYSPAEVVVSRLRRLRELGFPLGELAVALAHESGNLAALEFLLEEVGVEAEGGLYGLAFLAAENGDLAALQRLHSSSRPVDPAWCLSAAAGKGHLHVVSWLVDAFVLTAADLQEHAVRPAVQSGSVELVDWLAARGCDFTLQHDALTQAARGGCEAVLERLVELGCRMPDDGSPYVAAAEAGNVASLRCLRRMGCPWGTDDTVIRTLVAGAGPSWRVLPALHWLVEAGCPIKWAEALEATGAVWREYRTDVVVWLEEGLRRSLADGPGEPRV